jgi:hypothetical protein
MEPINRRSPDSRGGAEGIELRTDLCGSAPPRESLQHAVSERRSRAGVPAAGVRSKPRLHADHAQRLGNLVGALGRPRLLHVAVADTLAVEPLRLQEFR